MLAIYWVAWRDRFRWWWRGGCLLVVLMVFAGLLYWNAYTRERGAASTFGGVVTVEVVPAHHEAEAEVGRLEKVIPRRFAQRPQDSAGDFFGSALAAVGDWLFVSALWDDQFAEDSGVVHVYRRDAVAMAGWRPIGHVRPPEPKKGLSFGQVLEVVHEEILTVWVAEEPAGEGGQGSAGAFGCLQLFRIDAEVPPDQWKPFQTLRPETPGMEFGRWGACSEEGWLAVGARSESVGDAAMLGTVRLYRESVVDDWQLHQTLSLPALPTRAGFGPLVTMRGVTLAVAAFEDQTALDPPGKVLFRTHVYRFDEETERWEPDGVLPLTDLASFRVHLMAEDCLCVSGWLHYTTGRFLVRVFERRGDGIWKQVGALFPESNPVQSEFGSSMSSVGDELLVGSRNAQRNGVMHGAALLFALPPVGVEPFEVRSRRQLLPTVGHELSKFGEAVLLTEEDVLVGAPRFGGDYWEGGAVFVYDRASLRSE